MSDQVRHDGKTFDCNVLSSTIKRHNYGNWKMENVSIIMPAFNAEKFIKETINSILFQMMRGDELIIVDDGSTDNTKEVIKAFKSPLVRYFYQDNSGGPSAPRNKAIRYSQNEIIVIFDSDDLMHPEKLLYTREAIKKYPHAGLICSNFSSIDEFGNMIKKSYLEGYDLIERKLPKDNQVFYEISPIEARRMLAKENFVGTSSVAIPKKVIQKVGGFNEKLANAEDIELWLRITNENSMVFINKPLHYYRRRKSGNISSKRFCQLAVGQLNALIGHYDISSDQETVINFKKRISDTILASAYDHYIHGEMAKARSCIVKHRTRFLSGKHIQLFLKTLLGNRLAILARKIKRSFSSINIT